MGFPFIMIYQQGAMIIIGSNYEHRYYDPSMLDLLQQGLKLAEERENVPSNSKNPTLSLIVQSNSIFQTAVGNGKSRLNDNTGAFNAFQEAINWAEQFGNRSVMPHPLWGLSKIFLARGEFSEALTQVKRALELAGNTNQPVICQVLMTEAQIYLKLGQPDEARKALEQAIAITERLREQVIGGEIDHAISFEDTVAPYKMMIDFLSDRKEDSEAFSYAQRAKGRTLLEILQNGRINVNKSASPAEREKEQELNRKVIALNRRVTGEKLKAQSDAKRLAELEAELKNARLEFEAFLTTLYTTHPELKVQRGEIRPVSLENVAELIPDAKTALLDFSVTDDNVHLFVLTKNSAAQPALNTYTVKIERKLLAEKVERFRRRMENRDYDFQALSQELYSLLLKPAAQQLLGKTSLIISPDGVLWDLPFQVLLSPESRYLIEQAAISYAPSLSVLREMRHRAKKGRGALSLLALGNPALGNRSIELAKFAKMDTDLQPLPEAANQVRALGRLYGPARSKVITGAAAREELVKAESARYRILHLATHGILNDISPMYSIKDSRRDTEALLQSLQPKR